MKVAFWGAAQTVTGSMHELRVNSSRYLLDCGLYQGRRKEAREVNANLPFPAGAIDAILVSHAHIDHTGNLPTMVKNGYRGPIYTTPATIDLCHSMLLDSAFLQEKDALFLAKRNHRRRAVLDAPEAEIVEPLYSVKDAENTLPLFRPAPQGKIHQVSEQLSYTPLDAGHMLGSTALVIEMKENGKTVRLAFSGDVGRVNLPIIRDPEVMPPVDYVIMESTYGDRLHQDLGHVKDKLADAINRACQRGGKIVVPAFAVGRTQQVVLLLHQLIDEQRIPGIPMFVDSPLAVNVTEAFRKHTELFDEETGAFLASGQDPFGFKHLRYVRDVNESKALNDLRGPFLVISASGMCEAGRVIHHLRNTIEDPRNMVLVTGFMAENTLGRKIVDKQLEVPIFGEPIRLRAEVVKLNELSGHADQNELLRWLRPMAKTAKHVFLVHGELTQSTALAKAIEGVYSIPVTVPKKGDVFSLE